MKVKIPVTLDIPEEGVEAWKTEYGLDTTREVREDIKRYVRTALQECNGAEVAGWTVLD